MYGIFRFPRKKEIREAWIKALRREKYIPSNTAVVCSEHFIEEDFDRTSCLKTRIKENSIPSVFKAFPNYLQKVGFIYEIDCNILEIRVTDIGIT